LRVHIITLGIFTELIFGLTSILQSRQSQESNTRFRWDIWLELNMGLPVLLVDIPLFNPILISTGGTLILTAAILLAQQLFRESGNIRTESVSKQNFNIVKFLNNRLF